MVKVWCEKGIRQFSTVVLPPDPRIHLFKKLMYQCIRFSVFISEGNNNDELGVGVREAEGVCPATECSREPRY